MIQLAGYCMYLNKCEAVRSMKDCPKKSREVILWLCRGGRIRDGSQEIGDVNFFDQIPMA